MRGDMDMRTSPTQMKTSPRGMVALAASEGVVPAVYLDSVGVETFGVGVTKWAIGDAAFSDLPVAMPSNVDGVVGEALRMFPKVLLQYEEGVRQSVKVPLHQYEFDALVHFCYNVGVPNFSRSRLITKLNAGDYDGAGRSGFHGWLRPPELRGRRDMESALFLTGDYGGKVVPVYRTNGNKKLTGIASRIEGDAVLALMQASPTIDAPAVVTPPPAEELPAPRESRTESTTLRAQVISWFTGQGTALWAAWNATDDTTRMILAGGAVIAFLAGVWIFRERLKKWSDGIR